MRGAATRIPFRLCALIAGLASGAVHAQPPLLPTTRLSQQSLGAVAAIDRVKLALLSLSQDYPEILSAEAAASTSGYELEAAKTARYPRFKLGSSAGNSNSGTVNGGSKSYTVFSADVRMALMDGGGMSSRIRMAEAQTGAEGEALKSTVQKVVLDAFTAYLQVQRYDLKARVAERSAEVLGELLRIEQRRVDLGATGQNDLRMAASRRASVRAKQQDFEAQRADASGKFETYFRFPPRTDFLPTLAAPEQWLRVSREEALRVAEEGSTELAEARERIARAEAQVEFQKASRFPTLEAVYGKTHDPRGILVTQPTRIGVELNWNFGNGFDAQLRIRSALAEVDNQQAKFEAARRNLMELTGASWDRTSAGRERERDLREAVAESGAAFRGRWRLLEFGRETLPRVLDAQVDYYTLLQDYVDAVYDLRITELRLARATGRLMVARDGDNGWIDTVFTGAARPVLAGDGLDGTLCIAQRAPCIASPDAGTDDTGIALRPAGQMGTL